jgi:mRNA interferase RelE/StbE
MAYEIFIEKKAEKDLRRLPKNYQNKIIQKILNLKDNPKPIEARKITSLENYYRIKVGDYRIIYEINYKEKRVNIFRVRHRKEAYRNF